MEIVLCRKNIYKRYNIHKMNQFNLFIHIGGIQCYMRQAHSTVFEKVGGGADSSKKS